MIRGGPQLNGIGGPALLPPSFSRFFPTRFFPLVSSAGRLPVSSSVAISLGGTWGAAASVQELDARGARRGIHRAAAWLASGFSAATKRSAPVGRNRASPARLFKLNQKLSPEQMVMIRGKQLGGLVSMKAQSMSSDFSKWLMRCYNPETTELVIPDRGSIVVNAESIKRVFDLPNKGKKVIYEMNQEAISFITKEDGIEKGMAPDITTWCQMIKDMNAVADDKCLRAWLIIAMSCFLSPTTGLHVSACCYPNFINLDNVVNI